MLVNFYIYLVHENSREYQRMQALLEKQEEKYNHGKNTIQIGVAKHDNIYSIQTYAYNYYFFFIYNGIPLSFFRDTYSYFSYYVKTILCSYVPKELTNDDTFLTVHEIPFALGEIELDIFIKYTRSKDLKIWLKKYCVQELLIAERIDLLYKFKNFLNNNKIFKLENFKDQLINFCLILSNTNLDSKMIDKVFIEMYNFVISIYQVDSKRLQDIYEALVYIIKMQRPRKNKKEKCKLLSIALECQGDDKIIDLLSQYASQEIVQCMENSINQVTDDTEKCNVIFQYRKIIRNKEFFKYLNENLSILSAKKIFILLVERKINYSDIIAENLLCALEKEKEEENKMPFERFPKFYESNLEIVVLLKLFDFPIDLAKFEEYKNKSIYLEFIFDPENFDYSKVNTNNYMWGNLIRNKKYKDYFIKHKKDILNEELEKTFKFEIASTDQQKIVYGYLLDETELWNFGK